MPLDRDDRKWFDDHFGDLSKQIANLSTNVALTRQELMGHITSDSCKQIRAHERDLHDARKNWAFLGIVTGALVGIAEVLKHFALKR